MSKLIISLNNNSLADLSLQLHQAEQTADWIEIRLDSFPLKELKNLIALTQLLSKPVIWTLRTASQGGVFKGTCRDYLDYLHELLTYKPSWVDVEAWVTNENYLKLKEASLKTKWIVSWHQLPLVSEELELMYQRLILFDAAYYKLAVTASTVTDSLKLLNFAKDKNHLNSHLCVIGMGKLGQATRILAPLAACPFTYAALAKGQETACGQLTGEELLHTYLWKRLNEKTSLFGLIGKPVDYSASHLTHNAVFDQLNIEAVYVKFNLEPEELSNFLEEFHRFQGKGLSVTKPFKEKILPFLSSSFPFLSCNTLAWNQKELVGTNTDGIGAVNALGISLNDEKILIIGAGGTAKAIAQTAADQGAQVAVINRTFSQAEMLARQVKGQSGKLEDFKSFQKKGYLTVIQATSVGGADEKDKMVISSHQLDPSCCVLDVIAYPKETMFLRKARQKGCRTISGQELFIQQAIEQFVFWFGPSLNRVSVERILREQIAHSLVRVKSSKLKGFLHLPPSKSHSIRAILLAALAQGTSFIHHLLLDSLDIQAALEAAKQLGAKVSHKKGGTQIEGVAGKPQLKGKIINAGNSGQVLRFVGALAALSSTQTILTGDQSIRSHRSVKALIDGIKQLGGEALSIQKNGYAPFYVKGPLQPKKIVIDGQDSQPVSALLMAASFIEGTTCIQVLKGGEKPWVQLTLSWLDRLQVFYKQQNLDYFEVEGALLRPSFQFSVPGDWSSAAFLIVAALITHSSLTIKGVDFKDVQGDQAVVFCLQKLGAKLELDFDHFQLIIHPSPPLQGGVINVNDFIDAVPILAVLGCFMKSELILTHAEMARYKECNRLQCMTTELKKMGASIEETEGGLKILPSVLKGAVVNSHDDHRLALALIVAGLASEGETVVQKTDCIQKSFPDFIKQMQQLGGHVYESLF